MHLVGSVENHLAVVARGLHRRQRTVVEEAGALMFDDATRDLGVTHRQHLHDDLELAVVVGLHQAVHRDRHIVETVGALGEVQVPLEAGTLGLRGVLDRFGRAHHIDQADKRDLFTGFDEYLRASVCQGAAERPAHQHVRAGWLDLAQLRVVLADPFFDGPLDAVESDDRDVLGQSLEQRLVRGGGATGRVEHQHRCAV